MDTSAASSQESISAVIIFRLVNNVLCQIGILIAMNLFRPTAVKLNMEAYMEKKYVKRNTSHVIRSLSPPAVCFLAMYADIALIQDKISASVRLRIG